MVLDGNSIINRAYYGVRPLTTRDGFFTHAIFGFLTMLGRLLDEEKPEALCVAFDRREPTFRHLEYEGYKATRHAMPEELAMQMPVLKDVLDAMNIPRYELAGFEADDLIGTISRKCERLGLCRRHGRQGFFAARDRAYDRQAHFHAHGPDHDEGHDARELL